MKQQSRELLSAQLQEVLTAHRAGPSEPFEVAVLAGLLARYSDQATGRAVPPALAAARELLRSGVLRPGRPAHEIADALVDRLTAISEQDSEAERADALLDLDELCAGCEFLDCAEQCRGALSEAAGAIRAFPALWQKLAPWASRVLADAPPRPGDPALAMWRAVESCQYPSLPIEPPPCEAARRALGLALQVSRSAVTSQRQTLYAASELLPPPAVLQPLAHHASFELGLGAGPDGEPVLVVSCATTPQLAYEGCDVPLQKLGPMLHWVSAFPGAYALQVGTELLHFEVTE